MVQFVICFGLYILFAYNPVEVLNEQLSRLVWRFTPTKVMRVRNKDKPWFNDDRMHAFFGGMLSRVNWDEVFHCQVRAKEVYAEAVYARSRDVLMNAQCPQRWYCPLLSLLCLAWLRLFLSLVWVVDWFESLLKRRTYCQTILSMPSRDPVDLTSSYLSSPSLTIFAFRSCEAMQFIRILLELDHCGGTDILAMCTPFFKRTPDILAPLLSVVLRPLFRWVVCQLAGERLMSPQFQNVHLPR